MRTEKSFKNLAYAVLLQIVSSLLSFSIRYVLVHVLGKEAVSLNGLFTEVIAMLSLAELGVGTAIVYNLYKPLRENDEEKLAQLMNLFKTAYRIIALVVFSAGLLLLPFVHLLVSKINIELWYLRLIYFLFLLQTSLSYLFSYKGMLITADQKGYVVSRYSLIVKVLFAGLSIAVLLLTKNYIAYLLLQIASTLTGNFVVSCIVSRRYQFLRRRDRLPAEERKQVFANIKNIFIGTLSGKIVNSTDNILISTMVGTLYIGAYSSYTMLVNALKNLIVQFRNATTGSMGDLLAEGNHKQTELVLRRLTFITFVPTLIASVGIYTVSTPFIRLIYGEDYTLPTAVVFIIALNMFIYLIKNPLWEAVGVSGLFAQDKNISIAGDVVNLVVSILLGQIIGIAGILIGTICTLVTEHILKIRLFFGKYLQQDAGPYVKLLLTETAVGLFCILGSGLICSLLPVSNLYLQILAYGICSEAFTIGLLFLLFRKTPEFKYSVDTVKALLSGQRKSR